MKPSLTDGSLQHLFGTDAAAVMAAVVSMRASIRASGVQLHAPVFEAPSAVPAPAMRSAVGQLTEPVGLACADHNG